MSEEFDSNFKRYLAQMEKIKYRQSIIERVSTKKSTTGYRYSDIEICVLQIRKIIELIAMGSLVSNVELYSQLHEKYSSDWNARYIFRDIERINPSFYPEPITVDDSEEIGKFIHANTDFLTKEEAITVYDKCGGFLHEDNPFKKPHDALYYEKQIINWDNKIVRLLDKHLIHLSNGNMYYVIMRSVENGCPSGNILERVKNDSP